MNNPAIRHVPSTIVIGPHGQHCVSRGYTEIGKTRFYEDQLVVGPHGEYVIRRGEWSDSDE